jgi:hypothetical protein
MVVVGCAQDAGRAELRGLVVGVEAASFTQIGSFTLRTDDGQLVDLIVEGDVGMTPSHLREHMALGDPVRVTARRSDDLRIATRIEDANAQGTPTP